MKRPKKVHHRLSHDPFKHSLKLINFATKSLINLYQLAKAELEKS